MRLIDAEELEYLFNEQIERGETDAFDAFDDALQDTTTVDAVVVTRCKDCKYAYINSFSVSSGEALCTLSGQPMQQDDFCSYGERKDGES